MLRTQDAHGQALWLFGQTLGELPPAPRPDWQAAEPRWIAGALARALDRPAGGWHVLGACAALRQRPLAVQVEGRALALWRSQAGVHAADDQCPHLGAAWSRGRLVEGGLVCPWHGLRLDPAAPCSALYPTHDDGTLVWVQLPGEAPLPRPVLPVRPAAALVSVMSLPARCTPREVLENRLDPWHGAHFHGHSFARLAVREQADDSITVRVAFRVAGPLAVEVDARFHCPDRRSIVMTIVAGEGEGSLVETHATALSPGQCLITEAIFASSARSGFAVARRLGRLIQPLMRLAARRLWVQDAAYCERRHALRERASPPDPSCVSQESSP